MPSCVFKHCKNTSQKQKKDDGISFHRFPTNPLLLSEWVSIIRESRQEEDWSPSKFCVVCSLHFKDEDVYFTEKGRRLIKKTSKPTHNLFPSQQSPQTKSLKLEVKENEFSEDSESKLSRQLTKKTLKPTYNLSASPQSPQTTILKVEVKEEEFSEDSDSKLSIANLPGSCNEYQGLGNKVVDSKSALSLVPEQPREIKFVECGNKNAVLKTGRETPTKVHLRNELRKHQLWRLKTRRKLKTLQDQVRRLNKRNGALKKILKDLKDQNFINSDTEHILRKNEVAKDLFHNLHKMSCNKKKLRYTPASLKFCWTLHSYSPKAYEHVRKTFHNCLPYSKYLAKWYSHVKSEPGFIEEVLEEMVETSPQKLSC